VENKGIWNALWYMGEFSFLYLAFYHFFPSAWKKRIRSTMVQKERMRLSLQLALGVVLFHILFYPLL